MEDNYTSFLKLNVKDYQNRWIAIVNGEVVSARKSFKETYQEAKEKFPKKSPLIAKIPSKKVMIL